MSLANTTLPRHLLVALLASTGLASIAEAAEPSAPGGCNSVDGISCPAKDPVDPVTTGYDPSAVDWGAVVADIESIGNHEPRFCSFVIRAWFHDSLSIIPLDEQDKNAFDGGTDASFFTNLGELTSPEGSLHGFTQYARHVVVQLAHAHGTSLSDMVMVASSKCTNLVLGGDVDIAAHCESSGLPLHVGKLDHEVDGEMHHSAVTNKVESIPIPHNRMSHLLQFFIKDVNSLVTSGDKWKINAKDVMAIMGSHTIMMAHACTTTGEQQEGVSIDDRTCKGSGGRQRMFSWDNSFFQDISAGRCIQNSDMENRREMTLEQHQAFTMCGFDSMEGFELAEHLECDAMKNAKASVSDTELEILEDRGAFGKGWHHVVWTPDSEDGTAGNEPGTCCGHQCETCESNPESKFWCAGQMQGPVRMWPYTYMDCEFNWVYNLGGQGYCDGGKGSFPCGTCGNACTSQWTGTFGHQRSEMEMLVQEMTDAIETFRGNGQAWEEAYAEAFCKMSDFGSTYAPGKATLASVLNGGSGGGCLNPESALSLKQCSTCTLEEYGGSFSGGSGGSNGGGTTVDEPTADEPSSADVGADEPAEELADESADAPADEEEEDTSGNGTTVVVEETDSSEPLNSRSSPKSVNAELENWMRKSSLFER